MAKKKASAKTEITAESPSKPESSPPVTFEEALAEARKIVSRLESGDIPLAEALRDYESGISRLKACQEILQAAETSVSLLSGFDADGNPVTEPMPSLDKPAGAGRGRTAAAGNQSDASERKSRAKSAARNDLDDASGLF